MAELSFERDDQKNVSNKKKDDPYARLLKRPVTIRLDEGTVNYFKKIAKEAGIPYQTLINLYLRDCAASRRKLSLEWKSASGPISK
jgi:predicted DNA binding CopG/RHH family protein